jgi:hypothetical protein
VERSQRTGRSASPRCPAVTAACHSRRWPSGRCRVAGGRGRAGSQSKARRRSSRDGCAQCDQRIAAAACHAVKAAHVGGHACSRAAPAGGLLPARPAAVELTERAARRRLLRRVATRLRARERSSDASCSQQRQQRQKRAPRRHCTLWCRPRRAPRPAARGGTPRTRRSTRGAALQHRGASFALKATTATLAGASQFDRCLRCCVLRAMLCSRTPPATSAKS